MCFSRIKSFASYANAYESTVLLYTQTSQSTILIQVKEKCNTNFIPNSVHLTFLLNHTGKECTAGSPSVSRGVVDA